jgi:hypothetical protein
MASRELDARVRDACSAATTSTTSVSPVTVTPPATAVLATVEDVDGTLKVVVVTAKTPSVRMSVTPDLNSVLGVTTSRKTWVSPRTSAVATVPSTARFGGIDREVYILES